MKSLQISYHFLHFFNNSFNKTIAKNIQSWNKHRLNHRTATTRLNISKHRTAFIFRWYALQFYFPSVLSFSLCFICYMFKYVYTSAQNVWIVYISIYSQKAHVSHTLSIMWMISKHEWNKMKFLYYCFYVAYVVLWYHFVFHGVPKNIERIFVIMHFERNVCTKRKTKRRNLYWCSTRFLMLCFIIDNTT